jgi:predicted nucleotidyltransferase
LKILLGDPPEAVLGVVTFGSHARGKVTDNSDLDVCVFVRELSVQLLSLARENRLPFLVRSPTLEVAIYDKNTAVAMAELGSLFLWHLKLEGRIEYERQSYVSKLFASLSGCRLLSEELQIHIRIFELIMARRLEGEPLDIFDLSATHTILRNASILLCAGLQVFRFGKMDAFEVTIAHYGYLGVTHEEYRTMLAYHLLYHRGVPMDQELLNANVESLLASAAKFLERAKELLPKGLK